MEKENKIKNAMSLKAYIKNKATQNKVPAQLVMQNYMLERLLERISISKYNKNIILKGGFLISAIVGIDSRTTMDLDTTIKGLPLTKDFVNNIFSEICQISIDDNISFNIRKVDDIRKQDEYSGVRVFLDALYPPLNVPLSVDVTTGDKITPKEIEYSFKMMFEEKYINILAYNLETILAEKLETILSRGKASTRPRDYYDVYILYSIYKNDINFDTLLNAIHSTCLKRGSLKIFEIYKTRINEIQEDIGMNRLWHSYESNFEYAKGIKFNDICNIVRNIFEKISSLK